MELNNNISFSANLSGKIIPGSDETIEKYRQYAKNPEAEKARIKGKISMQGALSSDTFVAARDVFKDTPVRYLGFTNELGAAVSHICQGAKGLIAKIPALSWIPAIGYISLDVVDKYQKGENGTGEKKMRAGASELCTQMLQSVALPTIVIKGVQTAGKKYAILLQKILPLKAAVNGGKPSQPAPRLLHYLQQ